MTENPPLAFANTGIAVGHVAAFLATQDAGLLGLHAGDRVRVAAGDRGTTAVLQLGGLAARPGVLGASVELAQRLGATEGEMVTVHHQERPHSAEIIRRKLAGERLTPREMKAVMRDIGAGELQAIEVAGWACAVQAHGLDDEELVSCIEAMVQGGERVQFTGGPIVDVHSVGGVPGNSYAPITVAIVACHGLRIPKTSSRAISSACGTADLVEVACPVDLAAARIRAITDEVGGVLAWGGGVGFAPADDEIIRVEYPLSLDPPTQIVASVLAKKLAAGVQRVIIDIPWGEGAKLHDEAAVAAISRTFTEIGRRVGLQVACVPSDGSQPVGAAIGPALEMREVLRVLEGELKQSALAHKATMLAGRLLEMGGAAAPGQGHAMALATVAQGKALAKFHAIVAAQGGRTPVASRDIKVGPLHAPVLATREGRIIAHHNRSLVRVARAAGAPKHPGAGLVLEAEEGSRVGPGDRLLTVYAEHKSMLDAAVRLAEELQPVEVERA